MDGIIPKDAGANGRTLAPGGRLRQMMWPLLIMVSAIFLLAACGGGNGAADGIFMDMDTADEDEEVEDFELVAFGTENYPEGTLIRLSQYPGQPLVVNFWFPSCPPCRAEMPDLEQTFQNHKADGVVFIGVMLLGLDTAKDGQAFVDEVGVTYALGPDEGSDLTKGYEVTSFPTTFFLDSDHRVVKKWGGFLSGEKMEELVQELLPPRAGDSG